MSKKNKMVLWISLYSR